MGDSNPRITVRGHLLFSDPRFVCSVKTLWLYSLNVKEWKTPLFTFRAVPHIYMALPKELWLFHSFREVSLQDRVTNHSKRCKLQSKRVEYHSKRVVQFIWLFKECIFTLLHWESSIISPFVFNLASVPCFFSMVVKLYKFDLILWTDNNVWTV